METELVATPRAIGDAPMPPNSEQDIHRISIIGEVFLCMVVNTFYYRSNQPRGSSARTDQVALEVLFDNPATGVLPEYLECLGDEYKLNQVKFEVITKKSLAPLPVTPSAPLRGTVLGPILPNQMCVTIHRRSLWGGKHGRGRISMPAVPLAWTAGNLVTNFVQYDVLRLALGSVLTDATHTFTPGIYSIEPILGEDDGWVDAVTWEVNDVLGTARRRKPGVGK